MQNEITMLKRDLTNATNTIRQLNGSKTKVRPSSMTLKEEEDFKSK